MFAEAQKSLSLMKHTKLEVDLLEKFQNTGLVEVLRHIANIKASNNQLLIMCRLLLTVV